MSGSPDHPPGPLRPLPSRRRWAGAAAALTAGALALPAALGLGPHSAAIAPGLTPVPKVALPAALEAYSPWLPQVSCDPTLKPGVKAFSELVLATYARGRNGGTVRSCNVGGNSEHKEGRAWDWTLDPTNYTDVVAGARMIGWLLAADAAVARRTGVMYIIWNHRIWSTYRRAEGWRPYTGGDPHTSHMHVSFGWAGAMGRTSWWTGKVAPIEYGPCVPHIGAPAPPYGTTVNLEPCPPPKKAPKPAPAPTEDIPGPAGPGARFVPAPPL